MISIDNSIQFMFQNYFEYLNGSSKNFKSILDEAVDLTSTI